MTMIKILALGGALALPLIAGGCSSMMGGGDTASASTVSKDSAGAGASPQVSSSPSAPATVGTAGSKNP